MLSPIARIQNLNDVQTLTQYMEIAAGLGPEQLNKVINVELALKDIADKMGIPKHLLRSDKERAQMQQQQEQMMALSAAAELQKAMPPDMMGKQQPAEPSNLIPV